MDGMDPNIAPAPASPAAAPVTGGPQELPQEQMMANLSDLMSKIQSKYQDFNASHMASSAREQDMDSKIMRQVYDLFDSLGIDPTDVEQVKAYLDKLKVSNPELYDQVTQALQGLLGQETEGYPTDDATASADSQNMNIDPNEGISQNV